MPTNKDLERRITVLEELLDAQAKALVTFGTSIENLNVGLETIKKTDLQVRNIAGEEPYVSLKWNSARRLWIATLVNGGERFDGILVPHDNIAQAFQMLLQKLQRKVS